MKRILYLVALSLLASVRLLAVDLTRCTIVYSESDHPLVAHMASVLADDVERVSGIRPAVVRIRLTEPPTGKRKQYDSEGEELKYGRME